MITCFLRYYIDPNKIDAFELYAKLWIPLVGRYGGTHHGYFLPHESSNDVATAAFSFPSLAAYEQYRQESLNDPDCQAAYRHAARTQFLRRYDRSFMRAVCNGGLGLLENLRDDAR